MAKMAKIVITFNKKLNLLNSFVESTHSRSSKAFYNKLSGDNKVPTRNPIGSILQYIELFTGKRVRPIPEGEYPIARPDELSYYRFELPVSECGKYLLIDNPLSEE